MQTATDAFAAAASGSSVLWAPIRVFADWAGDGVGAAGSIDDLSHQVGRPIEVTHMLDDGLPSDLSDQSSDSYGTLSAPLSYGRVVAGEGQLTASQYFSPFNALSPIATYDRDTAPLTVDAGLIGENGKEYVRIFTGVMNGIDVPTGLADSTMAGVSATVTKLQKLVQPPPVIGWDECTSNTWLVSWTLAQCGVYVSPPPRTGCVYWETLHGGTHRYLPAGAYAAFGAATAPFAVQRWTSAGATRWRAAECDGPFLASLEFSSTAAEAIYLNQVLAFSSPLLTSAANVGRFEAWVRGDAATIPGALTVTDRVQFACTLTGNNAQAFMGVDSTRHVYVTVRDAQSHTVTLTSTGTIPTDGAWHFVGAAYSIAGKKLWVTLDGTAQSAAASTFVTTGLATSETILTRALFSVLPIAEVQITTGAQADPDTSVWINDATYWATADAGATVARCSQELVAIAETASLRACDLLIRIAQSEMAQTRCDELDLYEFLTPGWWMEHQTVAETLTTTANIGDLSVEVDTSRVRNSVSLSYRELTVGYASGIIVEATPGTTLTPGTTTVVLPATDPLLLVSQGAFTVVDGPTLEATPPTANYLCCNAARDGSDTYATSSNVSAAVTNWDPGSVTVAITVTGGTTWYLANGVSKSSIGVAGLKVTATDATVTARDEASITARGERGMSVTLDGVQSRGYAQTLANDLVNRYATPRKRIEGVTVFGDPRRQPGDLVTLADAASTKAEGLWRAMVVTHRIDGADYTQDVTLTNAAAAGPVGIWDESTWGSAVWR